MPLEVRMPIMAKLCRELEPVLALRAFPNGELNVKLPPFVDMYRSYSLYAPPISKHGHNELTPYIKED